MSGSETNESIWYDLVDPASELVMGQVTRDGRVRSDDPEVIQRVSRAFDRELLVRDDELAEELGVCFADINSMGPGDEVHHDLVFRNLGILAGLIPSEPRHPDRSG